jgi:two-component system cell cycle sensor histidine kinase/response regulator CckA
LAIGRTLRRTRVRRGPAETLMERSSPQLELRLTRALTLGLARAEDFEQSAETALAVIGEEAGWDLGLCWIHPPGSAGLEAGPTWRRPGAPAGLLETAAGWDRPLWVENLSAEADDPQVRSVLEAGFETAFAVPVLTQLDVVAVLQFFGRRADPGDQAFMEALCAAGTPLGAFLQGKLAEDELRAGELRFRAVVDTAGEAVISADGSATIVYANPAAHRIFGWEQDELIGRPIASLVPDELQDAQERGFKRFLETGQPRLAGQTMELAGRRRDGTDFPIEISVSGWEFRDRPFFTALVRDVSQRREAEEKLQASQATLKETHALARLGSWEWDLRDLVFTWSAELGTLMGLPPSDSERPTWERFLELVHPDDRRNVVEYVSSAVDRGAAGPFRYRIVRPDGQVRVLQGRGALERDERGQPRRLRAVSHDVTDLEEFESAFERLNRQHALILASASEGIVGVDAEGRTTFLNPAAERMLGWTAAEMLGRDAHETFHHTRPDGSPYPREECPILNAFARGEVMHEKGELLWRKDGTGLPVEYFAAPIREGAEVTGGVLLFSDYSEEEKTQRQRDRYEQRLRQAERLESLGRLAGGVAHDFNNLLAAILSYAVIVEDKLPESDPSRGDVGEIRRAAERAAALTQQLLLFGRGETARREIVDLNGLIQGMEVLLARALPGDSSLELTLSDEAAMVEVDPSQIEQVLLNLVVNSADALHAGGTVRIATELIEPSRDVRLRVVDDGDGMAPEVEARAFEPFFTTKPQGEGTGLGLATAYGVVTQSGGRVELRSTPGEGTEVVAHFPPAPGSPLPTEPAAEPPESQRDTAVRTVLLVEDEDIVRGVAARILSEAGYRVLAVSDPVQALALAERHDGPLHLLLTDMVMPQLSGSELARRVRQMRPEAEVLFMSGHPEAGHEGRTLLHKPFTPDDLLAAVRNVSAPS